MKRNEMHLNDYNKRLDDLDIKRRASVCIFRLFIPNPDFAVKCVSTFSLSKSAVDE